VRRCSCHGEEMDRVRGSNGGWRCAVKRRAKQRRFYHEHQRNDATYLLNKQLREMTRVRIPY
jgi:hypothetical protein